eukprot:scaffold66867_cov57-Phaeocystis_antarctica.AAC.4
MAHRPSRFLLREIERVGAAGALALGLRLHRGEAKQTKGDQRQHELVELMQLGGDLLNQARELRLGRPPAPCDVGVIGEPGHARVGAEHDSEVRRAFGVVARGVIFSKLAVAQTFDAAAT